MTSTAADVEFDTDLGVGVSTIVGVAVGTDVRVDVIIGEGLALSNPSTKEFAVALPPLCAGLINKISEQNARSRQDALQAHNSIGALNRCCFCTLRLRNFFATKIISY